MQLPLAVSNGVSAVVNAPTAGSIVKTGAGTLTLGASRAAETHVREGTLKMAPGATLSTSYQLQLGTGGDPSKSVTFDYGGQTFVKSARWYLVNGASVTLTNGVFASNSGDNMQISEAATIPSSLAVIDARFTSGGKDILFGHDNLSGGALPDNPQSTLAGTNAVFCTTGNSTFHIGRDGVTEGKTAGFYKADFDNCVITTRYFIVSNDRPLNNARLNNTRLVNGGGDVGEIKARDGDAKWITVGPGGLTLDTRTVGWNLYANLGGPGVVTKVGAGKLEIVTNQTGTAALNVNEGSIVPRIGVSVERPVAVASNAVLGVFGSKQASFANVTFAAGSIFDVMSYYYGETPVSFGSLTFPEENGAVTLKYNGGAFPKGVYAIYEKSGVTAVDGAKFALETADDLAYTWSVADDTLILTVGEASGNFWTGLGDGVSMSDGANWLSGSAPAAGADIDFSGVSFNTTINADAGVTYGAVTMCSSGYIAFTNALAATSFSDLTKLIVGENSTVTIDGDLEFSSAEAEYIVNYVAAGGKFVVTGDIKEMPGKTGHVYPCLNYNAHKGVIAAKGLVNNSTSDRANRFALTRGYPNTQVNWEIGEHGISGTDGFWKPVESTVQSTITAEADFRISSEMAIQGPLTFATTGTDGQAHTIEITGDTARLGICGSSVNYSVGISGSITITGAGRVVADYNVNNLTSKATEKANAFNVQGTATFALKPGSNIGTGRVTVTNAATLAVCESGTVTLNGSLALADGASLGFNFTNIRTPPVLACANAPTFIEGEATNITVKVSGDVRPSKGEKVLTTCGGFDADGVTVTLSADAPNWVAGLTVNGDGNLVLAVKPKGLMLIVK